MWEVEQIRWRRAWTRADRAESTIDTYTKKVGQYLEWCQAEGKNSTALASADLYVDHLERSKGVHSARWAGRALCAYGKFLANEYDQGNPFAKLKPPALPQASAPYTAMATEDDLTKLLVPRQATFRVSLIGT